jgi:hypothetical protein
MKLNKRKCKNCSKEFQKESPLQSVCSITCGIERAHELNKKKREKELKDKVKVMRVNAKATTYKKYLQDEINLLSRKIDAKFEFNCIDCGKAFSEQQVDACHLISRKKNGTLKYNLHNLHSGHNHCNVYNPEHESNYKKGLILRYGANYLEMVENLPIIYKEIHLTNVDIMEKLTLVRKINRTFDTYNFTSGDNAREIFNKIIGIYNK